jgi:peptidoglycan/xylan/chitin deacetylase (PgdA/CDA1 family)
MTMRLVPEPGRWPAHARTVVCMTLDFDGPSLEVGRGIEPLGVKSHGRYSAKCGIPRFAAMFERAGVPWTFFVPGYDAEQHPQIVRDLPAPAWRLPRTAICTKAPTPAMPSPRCWNARTAS